MHKKEWYGDRLNSGDSIDRAGGHRISRGVPAWLPLSLTSTVPAAVRTVSSLVRLTAVSAET